MSKFRRIAGHLSMGPPITGFALILAILTVSCNDSSYSKESNLREPEIAIEPTATSTAATTIAQLEAFPGCWSSGSGKILRISEKEIFCSTNGFKPVKFIQEKRDDNLIVLRLLDRPQFYYFQEFLTLEIDNNQDSQTGFPFVIQDYLSLNDIGYKKQAGISGWVRDDCAKVFYP